MILQLVEITLLQAYFLGRQVRIFSVFLITSFTLILSIHLISLGQGIPFSPTSGQSSHSFSFFLMCMKNPFFNGPLLSGEFGPSIAIYGVFTLSARCIIPESFPISNLHLVKTAASCLIVVWLVKLITFSLFLQFSNILLLTGPSSGPPKRIILLLYFQ